jgi:hypothetical protein
MTTYFQKSEIGNHEVSLIEIANLKEKLRARTDITLGQPVMLVITCMFMSSVLMLMLLRCCSFVSVLVLVALVALVHGLVVP